jgi:hypothetical protein
LSGIKFYVPQNCGMMSELPDVLPQNCGKVSELRMECYKPAWLNPNFGWGFINLHR